MIKVESPQMSYRKFVSQDGTIRLQFSEGFTTVFIPTKDEKWACCVSSQIGCPVGCSFCYTPKLKRNLTSEEIVMQFTIAREVIGNLPTSVVFMGQGEPMLNFRAVHSAILQMNKLGLSFRHITLSTSGFYVDKLLDVPYHVALSLHSPFDAVRQKLMPVTKPIAELVAFANAYSQKRKFGIMIEYALMKGVNDRDEDLVELACMKWESNVFFNFIEFNNKGEFVKSERLELFKETMRAKGYKAFIRPSRGADIAAACGMLDYIDSVREE